MWNNKENDQKRRSGLRICSFTGKLSFIAVCLHMAFIKERSINKSLSLFTSLGSNIPYQIGLEFWIFHQILVWEIAFDALLTRISLEKIARFPSLHMAILYWHFRKPLGNFRSIVVARSVIKTWISEMSVDHSEFPSKFVFWKLPREYNWLVLNLPRVY